MKEISKVARVINLGFNAKLMAKSRCRYDF